MRYGVDPAVVMAIYGKETSYGTVTGSFDLLDALASLACRQDDTVSLHVASILGIAAYIAWASDPKQNQRKQAGVGVLIFLFLFAGITYVSYRRIWKGVAH